MQKTFLVLVSSVLKWGKQSIRKAKWGDCIMSCGIRKDADLWSGLCLRSQKYCWPAGTHPAQGNFMCLDFRMRGESCGYVLSPISTPLPFYLLPTFFFFFFLHLYPCISYGSWKVITYYFYRLLYYIFKGRKRLSVKLPNQILAKMVQGNGKVSKLQLNGWDVENTEYHGQSANGIMGPSALSLAFLLYDLCWSTWEFKTWCANKNSYKF